MSTDPCLDAALAYIRKDRAVVDEEILISALRVMRCRLWDGKAKSALLALGFANPVSFLGGNPEDVFFLIGDRLKKVESRVDRVSLAMQIFGKGGPHVLYTLSTPASRPSFLKRVWGWYKRVTGYEKAMLQRSTGLKIRSTCHEATAPRRHDVIDQVMGGAR
jgi:hypothetical protein